MSALTRQTATNRSGCVGVCVVKRRRTLRGGVVVIRRWWAAQCGSQMRRFSIDSLGSLDAFREAVRARAAWVRGAAPLESARRVDYRHKRNQRYRQRHSEREGRRHRAYAAANRDQINARRKVGASPAARAAAVARTRAWRQSRKGAAR